jgi:Type II site-specific deoxyribonuclease
VNAPRGVRAGPADIFDERFLTVLRELIDTHHSIYPVIPPQGIFFEYLAEQAFKRSGWPADEVILTTPNSPTHDLKVGPLRLSLKTETGKITRKGAIAITKLCTTETGNWDSPSLIAHAIKHLDRYDHILMLRAIWRTTAIGYQLVDVPLSVLRLISGLTALPVGKRAGRHSLGADVFDGKEKVFRIHFDGADGKCQIRGLAVSRCSLLLEWEQPLP